MAENAAKPSQSIADGLEGQPLAKPSGPGGIGPTLGEDVSVEHERALDKRFGAEDQGDERPDIDSMDDN